MNRTAPDTRLLGYRFITIVLGAILLAAGAFKGVDLDQFALQIRQYGILPDDARLAVAAAWFMVVVEVILGAALVANWRPKASLSGVILLLLFFMGALSWAMVHGGVSDCGCFGPAARRSPTEAMIEDGLLLVFAFFAWKLKDRAIYYRHPMKSLAVATAAVIAMTLPLALGTLQARQSASASQASGQAAGMVLQTPSGGQVDLNTGTCLVALMATDCMHCRQSVPLLNEMVAEAGNALTVYALAADDQAAIDRFVEENFAFYPVLPVTEKSLLALMKDDPLPQYLLIQNGRTLARWQDKVPERRALVDVIEREEKGA
jgi:thiol-disulfide isomerase/thioredoxin